MSDGPRWQRPHPLTVIVLVASFVAGNAFPLLAVVAFGGGGFGFDTVAVAVGGATVGYGALGWYMTGYAVTDDAVEYRSGILNRQARTIPLDRIQQVSVGEPVLARIVGLAVVQVAEASADGDVEIRYLGLADARALTERLRQLARARDGRPAAPDAAPTSSLPPPPERTATLLHTTSLGDLVRYQLGVVAPAVLAVSAFLAAAMLSLSLSGGAAWISAATIGPVIAVMLVLGPVGAVLTNGNFSVRRGARSLTIDAGLLSRRHVEVRTDRVQTLTVSSGPIVRRLGLHEIRFSAATGKAVKQQQQMVHLSPAARSGAVAAIVQGAIDVDPGFGVELEPVSRMTIRRTLIRAGIVYVVVGLPVSIVLWSGHPVAGLVPTLVWWPLALWYAKARFRRLGVSLDGRRLVVRRGVLYHHLGQLPLTNVQSVSTSASFFQRRLGLADLLVSTAGIGPGHHVRVPDLPAARANELRVALARVAAESVWELRG